MLTAQVQGLEEGRRRRSQFSTFKDWQRIVVLEQDFVRVQEWLQVNEDSGKIHADPYRSIILPVLARKKGGCQSLLGPGDQGGHSRTRGHLDDWSGLAWPVTSTVQRVVPSRDSQKEFKIGRGELPLEETIGAGALTGLLRCGAVAAHAAWLPTQAEARKNAPVKMHRSCCRCGLWIAPGAAEQTMGPVGDRGLLVFTFRWKRVAFSISPPVASWAR